MRASAASLTAPRADAAIIASRSTPPTVSDAITRPAYRGCRRLAGAGEHSDVAGKGFDEAAQFAEDKTGGKFDSQIQGAEQQAEGYLGVQDQDSGNQDSGNQDS
jgi:hypothetical protein